MNEQKQLIEEVEKEECEHFDKEVCSRLNCNKDCKYYGKSNCYRCNHKEICQLRTFSYCEEEVREKGCEYYQQEIPENAVVLTRVEYEKLKSLSTIEEITLGAVYDNTRKETAEKIMNDISNDIIVVNTKEYGNIEVIPTERLQEICTNIIEGN